MIAVCDASPLIALGQVGRLNILKVLFTRICIPDAVYLETVTRCKVAVQRRNIASATEAFIEVRHTVSRRVFERNLGAGERGVIELALDLHTDVVLMDDKKARNEAKALGLVPFFTTDLLYYAEQQGLIPSYRDILEELNSCRIFLPR
jgi:predicted nucleic acid-binding protein